MDFAAGGHLTHGYRHNVSAKMFEVLASADINIEMISTSAIRISCIVREAEVERAVQALHGAFELGVQ